MRCYGERKPLIIYGKTKINAFEERAGKSFFLCFSPRKSTDKEIAFASFFSGKSLRILLYMMLSLCCHLKILSTMKRFATKKETFNCNILSIKNSLMMIRFLFLLLLQRAAPLAIRAITMASRSSWIAERNVFAR